MTFWPDPENSLNCAKSGAAAQAVAPYRRLIPAPMVLSGTRYRGVCSGTVGSRRQNPSLSQDETHESSRIPAVQWRVMTTYHCARRISGESVASTRPGLARTQGRVETPSKRKCLGFVFSGPWRCWCRCVLQHLPLQARGFISVRSCPHCVQHAVVRSVVSHAHGE